jgi:hypothetical protein
MATSNLALPNMTFQERFSFLIKRILLRLSVSPFRIVAYVLHATGLEHIYKPRFERHSALLHLTDEVVAKLPKHSLSITGARMDPMNLIFVGTDTQLKLAFKTAGWRRANPASPVHLLYGLLTVVTGRSYRTAPFMPHFINIGLQDFAFQMVEGSSAKQRHHLRIWRTGIRMPDGKRIWLGACCFDISVKAQLRPPFVHHGTDPNFDKERDFIVRNLENQGAYRLKSVIMSEPVLASHPRSNAHGGKYFTDGRAVVVEV